MAGAGKIVTITVCEIAFTEMLEPKERIAHLIKARKGRHTQLYVARKFAAHPLDVLELGRRLKCRHITDMTDPTRHNPTLPDSTRPDMTDPTRPVRPDLIWLGPTRPDQPRPDSKLGSCLAIGGFCCVVGRKKSWSGHRRVASGRAGV